jgi:adenylate cyclase, class 2
MAMSRRESEIKLAFPAPGPAVQALVAIGARETHPRTFEDNVLFDLSGGPLSSTGRLLRLRRYGAATIVTFKGPVEGEHRHKVRTEHETVVVDAEAMRRILEGAGFEKVYRYQKFRTLFRIGGVEAAVDETPLGTFVELEGEPDEIDRVASALGCDPTRYIRETYRELQEREAARRGLPAGDLLMPERDGSP